MGKSTKFQKQCWDIQNADSRTIWAIVDHASKEDVYKKRYHLSYLARKDDPDFKRFKLNVDSNYRIRLRISIMDIIGGRKCIMCGFDKDLRALQLDHINSGGNKEYKFFKGNTKMYRYYAKNPEVARIKLQVLCANCNCIKRHTSKEWGKVGK